MYFNGGIKHLTLLSFTESNGTSKCLTLWDCNIIFKWKSCLGDGHKQDSGDVLI